MARRLEVEIIGNSRSFERALGRASGAGNRFGRSLGRLAKVAAGAVAAGLFFAGKAAVDFESSFAGVRKTVDGTEAQLQKLSSGIRDMAKEIPTGVNQLNAIAESAGQLGIKRQSILGFTRVVADLGETTNLVGEEAASSLARLANITQMPQKNFDRLGATIVALGNAGASTEKEIVDMGLRIAGAGKQIGLSESDVLGFANALSSVGLEAESGGSAISRVMIDIAKATRSGGAALEKFADVAGMSSSEFKRAFEKDAAGAVISFIEGLGELGEEGGNVFKVLDDLGLGTIRVRDTLLRAAGAGDLMRESLKLGSEAWEENTALTEEAAKRYETTASQLNILKNNVIDLGISIGERLLPPLNEAAQGLTGLLEKVREADGLKAKISVVFTSIRGALSSLRDRVSDALTDSFKTVAVGPRGSQIERVFVPGLITRIQEGLRSVDWSTIGQQIGDGISESVRITADFLENLLTQAEAFINANWDRLAELGAVIIAGIFAKLLDPEFWARHWRLAVAVGVAVFPVAKIAKVGVMAARAILGQFAKLLPSGFRGIGGRAIDAILGQLGKLPGRVQGIILRVIEVLGRVVSFIRGKLSAAIKAIPGWIRAAFKIGAILTFIGALERVWNWLVDITSRVWKVIVDIDIPNPGGIFDGGLLGRAREDAAGTNFHPGGLGWVGERGPELVSLPRGSKVFSHNRSMQMAGGGGGPIHVHLHVGERELADVMVDINKNYARQNGGKSLF